MPIDLGFECRPNHVTAIFGASGAGKTTVLRSIAGLHRPSAGRVTSGDEVWFDAAAGIDVPPHRRAAGFVAQDYALFPHLTALGNVVASLSHRPRAERRREAERLLALVHLENLRDRRPAALSGGEQQRLALARALGRDPKVLLLDEPFAAMDRTIRRRLHDELDDLRRRLQIPVVLVTHDFEDVIRLATDVVLIENGRAIAASTIEDVTSRPDLAWLQAAAGLGSVFQAWVSSIDAAAGLATLSFEDTSLVVPAGGLEIGSTVRVRVPARDVILATARPAGISLHNVLDSTVTRIHAPGTSYAVVQLAIGSTRLLAEVTRDAIVRLGLATGRRVLSLIKSVAVEVTATRPADVAAARDA
jgi:molybdate transport system ATP-binding protein